MEIKQMCFFDNICDQICQIPGIRFAGIINKKGRKVAGGFSNKVTPLEKDVQKMDMLFMEIVLDFSMRKDFDNSLGNIHAIVSYRDRVNIVTIPHQDDLILLSIEPELNVGKVIQIVHKKLASKFTEVITQ